MTGTLLRGLAWDVALPVATYDALHLLGASDGVALLVFGIGLALTFVSGDPRFLLIKESFVTGAVG